MIRNLAGCYIRDVSIVDQMLLPCLYLSCSILHDHLRELGGLSISITQYIRLCVVKVLILLSGLANFVVMAELTLVEILLLGLWKLMIYYLPRGLYG